MDQLAVEHFRTLLTDSFRTEPVRRLVLHGEWLVDLTITEQAARQRG